MISIMISGVISSMILFIISGCVYPPPKRAQKSAQLRPVGPSPPPQVPRPCRRGRADVRVQSGGSGAQLHDKNLLSGWGWGWGEKREREIELERERTEGREREPPPSPAPGPCPAPPPPGPGPAPPPPPMEGTVTDGERAPPPTGLRHGDGGGERRGEGGRGREGGRPTRPAPPPPLP